MVTRPAVRTRACRKRALRITNGATRLGTQSCLGVVINRRNHSPAEPTGARARGCPATGLAAPGKGCTPGRDSPHTAPLREGLGFRERAPHPRLKQYQLTQPEGDHVTRSVRGDPGQSESRVWSPQPPPPESW